MPKPIKKILVANRGEIAVRVMRACKDLGIGSVAVFSDADKTAYHVRMADEAYHIGPSPSSESYLVQDKIIAVAKRCGADAIHPGYGFLAENAKFAQRCADEGIIFIGPCPETIRLLGDKIEARRTAIEAGLPVVPGTEIDANDLKDACKRSEKLSFPVLIKATAGGGGKGMRIVESADQFADALQRASSEAASAFGDGRVFVEKYLAKPRHIEFQILCDEHGGAVHLGERECSIQRRHQKLIEESPSPMMTADLRESMGKAAVDIALRTKYVGAGTVEFMVDETGEFYFLEVNTRLQVEHPVTELVTGIDLVKEQIAIAEGKPLAFTQQDVKQHGCAIECRICAEDPQQGFVPSTGKLKNYRMPAGPGVRVDSGVVIFADISIFYDPMFAKLVVWGASRTEAIERMRRALEEFRVSGVKTTLGFHRVLMDNEKFIAGDISTRFLSEEYPDNKFVSLDTTALETAAIATAIDKFVNERKIILKSQAGSSDASSRWTSFYRRRSLRALGDTN
jgi:acetyl-CoA carboxylase biotin carboxylase subunit